MAFLYGRCERLFIIDLTNKYLQEIFEWLSLTRQTAVCFSFFWSTVIFGT